MQRSPIKLSKLFSFVLLLVCLATLPSWSSFRLADVNALVDGTDEARDVHGLQAGEEDPIDPEPEADLQVRKFGRADGQVNAGEDLTYTIVVDNFGPDAAPDVVMRDLMQSSGSFQLVSVSSDRDAVCTPAAGVFAGELDLSCTLTPPLEVMTAPDSGRWTVEVVIRANDRQHISNLAAVWSAVADPDLENNEARAEHEISDVADLAITELASGENLTKGCPAQVEILPDKVTPGGRLQYLLTVSNNGPSAASQVVVRDQLPATIHLKSVTSSKGSCNIDIASNSLFCGVGSIAAAATVTVAVEALVDPGQQDGSLLVNNALVTADTFDDNNSNDFANSVTTVHHVTDLKVTKSAVGDVVTGWDAGTQQFVTSERRDAVSAGSRLRYKIITKNDGLAPVYDVSLTDRLPFELQQAVGATCEADENDPALTVCEIAELLPGEEHLVELVGESAASLSNGSVILNEVQVSSAVPDACAEDNTAHNSTKVNTVADRFIMAENAPLATQPDTDAAQQDSVAVPAGGENRYKVTIGSSGPSVATGLKAVARLKTFKDVRPGETLLRCIPIAPVTAVVCKVDQAHLVRVTRLVAGDDVIIAAADAGRIDPGSSYSFFMVTEVARDYLLQDEMGVMLTTFGISGAVTDFRLDNNASVVNTQIVPGYSEILLPLILR